MTDAAPADDLEETVRRSDPDRWLASRFIADAQARADVIALYAFDHVLARVPTMVSEPLMGEIRLTWWSEALDEIYAGGRVRSHPVAQALTEAVRRHGLDRAPLDDLIGARMGDLDAAPFLDEADAAAYASQTSGALMQTAAQALGAPAGFQPARLAGQAYGLSLLLHRRAIGGKTRLPEGMPAGGVHEALRAARSGLKAFPVPAFPAVAYACLSPRYAKGAHMTVLEKQWRLFWAAATGGV